MPLRHSCMKDSKGRPGSFVMMVSAKTSGTQYIIFFRSLYQGTALQEMSTEKRCLESVTIILGISVTITNQTEHFWPRNFFTSDPSFEIYFTLCVWFCCFCFHSFITFSPEIKSLGISRFLKYYVNWTGKATRVWGYEPRMCICHYYYPWIALAAVTGADFMSSSD